MRIIDTSSLTPESLESMSYTDSYHVYNGLDCCVTYEILDALLAEADEVALKTYDFSRALQAPILEMNMRGVKVDIEGRDKLIHEFESTSARLTENFNYLCLQGIGRHFDSASHHQLKALFYDVMGLPEIKKRNAKGIRVRTVDRNALEKLRAYFHAQPLISHILGVRDLEKKLQFLRTGIDADGRLRTSFNIAGTNTGRLASNYSDFGSGTNLQNVERKLRRILIADDGWKFCNIDLEQGDSRNLGYLEGVLFGDWRYLDACESGDLHTAVAKLTWPELPWPGDPAGDRAIADQIFYRDMTYRDTSKRLGHGTNYEGTPFTMAQNTKIPQKVVKEFQGGYFNAFPAHLSYHEWVRIQLRTKRQITTPFGRRRCFYGRASDDTVAREAIAYPPQSMTADEIDTALLKIWELNRVQCMLQVHDSLTLQYKEEEEDEILPLLLRTARVPLYHNDREFVVPVEAKIGWNLGDADKDNPDGLTKWKGGDVRRRAEAPVLG